MGLLDSFEKGLERAVNSAFAKTFRSGIQPVEIASALRREADTKAAVVSRDRIIAPNSFVVRLSTDDAERMRGLGAALTDELHALLTKHAKSQGYSFAGPLSIALEADDKVATGTVTRRAPARSRAASAGRPWSTSTAAVTRSPAPARSSDAARMPTSRSRMPDRAASTSRSCGTASAP